MRIEGSIRPTGDGAGFCREAWCQLVSRRPEFRRHLPRQIRNPFTGGPSTVAPREDCADVVLEGNSVGKAYWSMSEEPLVCVIVELSAMPLVLEWAKELQGEFQKESWGIAESDTAPDRGA
jgi:hypothetical protein